MDRSRHRFRPLLCPRRSTNAAARLPFAGRHGQRAHRPPLAESRGTGHQPAVTARFPIWYGKQINGRRSCKIRPKIASGGEAPKITCPKISEVFTAYLADEIGHRAAKSSRKLELSANTRPAHGIAKVSPALDGINSEICLLGRPKGNSFEVPRFRIPRPGRIDLQRQPPCNPGSDRRRPCGRRRRHKSELVSSW